MEFNNPFSILSLKLLGVGLEIAYEWSATSKSIDVSLSLLMWHRTWTWDL